MTHPTLTENEKLILRHLRRHGPTPRSGLGPAAGVSAQAVSNIARRLIGLGLLREGSLQRGKVGQPSMPLSLDPDGAFFFGLKIGRRLAELALVDFGGEVRMLRQQAQAHPDPDQIIGFARSGIAAMGDDLPPALRERIVGLGIAAPFRLWDWGVEFGPWRGRDLQAELAQALDMPVALANDASAACGAEQIFGAGNLSGDFLYLYIAHFVGGGLVLDGRLRLGPHGNAGGVGSMPLPDGGQMLDLASVATLEAQIGAQLPPEDAGWTLAESALDRWARRAGDALGFAALSAAALCDLSTVVIDGALPPEIRALLLRETRVAMARLPGAGLDLPDLREGTLGRRARILGAAALPLSQVFLPGS